MGTRGPGKLLTHLSTTSPNLRRIRLPISTASPLSPAPSPPPLPSPYPIFLPLLIFLLFDEQPPPAIAVPASPSGHAASPLPFPFPCSFLSPLFPILPSQTTDTRIPQIFISLLYPLPPPPQPQWPSPFPLVRPLFPPITWPWQQHTHDPPLFPKLQMFVPPFHLLLLHFFSLPFLPEVSI